MATPFLGIIVSAAGLLGCLNEYDPNQTRQQAESALLTLETPKPKRALEVVRRELEKRLAKARTKETLNDLAVVYIRAGEVKRAIPLLEEVERRFPGEYRTATNLGTAYELDGRNELALRWIAEGIRRNKDSHAGTEWLHVRILEAKLALAKEPAWLESHRVSGVTRDETGTPWVPKGQSVRTVWSALQYQLRERLPFTPEKDEIVSQLLEDYAYLTSVLAPKVTTSVDIYRLAARYGSGERAKAIEEKANAALPSSPTP